MKVAGGLLCSIGGLLVVMNILYQNDTGHKMDPSAVLLGIVLVVIGILLCAKKPKSKDDKKK